MYLSRNKNGKLGRHLGSKAKGRFGSEIKVEDTPFAPRQRDVCVRNESDIDRDQYGIQMGEAKKRAKASAVREKRRALAIMQARAKANGKALADRMQKRKKKDKTNNVLKGYFGRRAHMGESQRTIQDLVRWGNDAVAAATAEDAAYHTPPNPPRFDAQLMCNTPGVVPTPTANFLMEYTVPDTEFKRVLSLGPDSRADFEAQFPVGSPISQNGGTTYLDAGPSYDWMPFVDDSEKNNTRARGNYFLDKHSDVVVGNQIVGGTLLGRSNGKSINYHGYGKSKKAMGYFPERPPGRPVQANFGKMGEWYDPTSWFGNDTSLESELYADDPDQAAYAAEEAAYQQELADWEAEQAQWDKEDSAAAQEPSWLDRLTGGLTAGLTKGAESGIQTVAQREIVRALSPEEKRQQQAQAAATRAIQVASAPNPIARAGAKMGMSPVMTYAALAGVGLTLALVLLKARK